MSIETLSDRTTDSLRRQQCDAEGFYLHREPVASREVLERAVAGLEAVRDGKFDTGETPVEWKPVASPKHLVKIEQPQLGSRALRELLKSPALGKLVGEITGADWVQVWWVQGLIKPSADEKEGAKVGWHQDRQYWDGWTDDS